MSFETWFNEMPALVMALCVLISFFIGALCGYLSCTWANNTAMEEVEELLEELLELLDDKRVQ
jgi:membrane protein DedA with SNARE-associated domain